MLTHSLPPETFIRPPHRTRNGRQVDTESLDRTRHWLSLSTRDPRGCIDPRGKIFSKGLTVRELVCVHSAFTLRSLCVHSAFTLRSLCVDGSDAAVTEVLHCGFCVVQVFECTVCIYFFLYCLVVVTYMILPWVLCGSNALTLYSVHV